MSETVLDVLRGGVHVASFPTGRGITVLQGSACARVVPPAEATVSEVLRAEQEVARAALLVLARLGWVLR